jgi:putative membrane protein
MCDGILREIGEHCSRLAERQQISDWRYSLLEQRLVGLTEVQATCERIKFTPLPFPYTLLLHRTIYIFAFCCRLPWPSRWAGWRRCSPPSWGTPSSGWMRLATNWKTRSGGMRTTCRPMPGAHGGTGCAGGAGEQQLPPALLPVGYVLS